MVDSERLKQKLIEAEEFVGRLSRQIENPPEILDPHESIVVTGSKDNSLNENLVDQLQTAFENQAWRDEVNNSVRDLPMAVDYEAFRSVDSDQQIEFELKRFRRVWARFARHYGRLEGEYFRYQVQKKSGVSGESSPQTITDIAVSIQQKLVDLRQEFQDSVLTVVSKLKKSILESKVRIPSVPASSRILVLQKRRLKDKKPGPKLKKLVIHKYRSVKPGTKLEFDPLFNIVVGVNGSGKTTLLELISKIARGVADFPNEEVSIEYSIGFESTVLNVSITTVAHESEASQSQPYRRHTYGARFLQKEVISVESDSDCYRVESLGNGKYIAESNQEARREFSVNDVPPAHGPRVVTACHHAFGEPMSRHVSEAFGHFEQKDSIRLDESLAYFESLTNSTKTTSSISPILECYFGLPSSDMQFAWRSIPEEFIQELQFQLARPRDVDLHRISAVHAPYLSFLEEFVRIAKFRSAIFEVEAIESDRNNGETHITFGHPSFRFERQDSTQLTHHVLSFGQKRLLAYLYYLALNPDYVISDELVNGLHFSWIEECIDLIGDRQAFLASQSPLLLDHLTFSSAEEAKKRFVLCHVEQSESDGETLVWRSMSDEEAEEFYQAYEIGIEHVSTILRNRGLW